ncbi:uncharacterized protein LOC118437384 isoform X2 [Folsomia candida]|uniref:uncharacterized protein LOC118437384 isoform X2 n=1 Tax=Folsomia candida TaxID=158441 RepID=UPI001604EC7F|nr:uncharacterized protein LOC118437384 isoform X2 [Folsomia candida]
MTIFRTLTTWWSLTILCLLILPAPGTAQIDLSLCVDQEELCTRDENCIISGLLGCTSSELSICEYEGIGSSCCRCFEGQCFSNNECMDKITCPAGQQPYCVMFQRNSTNRCICVETAPLATIETTTMPCLIDIDNAETAESKWVQNCADSGAWLLNMNIDSKRSCICDKGCSTALDCPNECGADHRAACLRAYTSLGSLLPRQYCGCENYCDSDSECGYLNCKSYEVQRCSNGHSCYCSPECTSTSACPECSTPPKEICFKTSNRNQLGECGCISTNV